MTSDCNQGTDGYYKTLLEFTADGKILAGNQGFHDSSCTSTADTIFPYSEARTYTQGTSQTLEDGASGYSITVGGFEGGGTASGYYTITAQNALCFSTNFTVNTGMFSSDGTTSSQINYNSCLSAHSDTDTGSTPAGPTTPGPGPTTPTTPQDSNLVGIWWLRSTCFAMDDGTSAEAIMKFTAENELHIALFPYQGSSCTGDSTASVFELLGMYSDLGPMTLPSGVSGYGLEYNGEDAYYVFDAENRLCLSYSMGFTESMSTDIDYENCLDRIDQDN
jgi:hypothetical protein